MKSDLNPNRYFIECPCGSHEMFFEFDDDTDFYDEAYVRFTSPPVDGFWARVKMAFKYVFKKWPMFSLTDYVQLSEKNLHQFKAVVSEMERRIYKKHGEIDFLQAKLGATYRMLEEANEVNDTVGIIQYTELIKEIEQELIQKLKVHGAGK